MFAYSVRFLLYGRYTFPTVQLFRQIREDLIWADGGAVKKATDEAILSLLGPKTEADQQARSKKPAKKVICHATSCKKAWSAILGCRAAEYSPH